MVNVNNFKIDKNNNEACKNIFYMNAIQNALNLI